MSCFYLLFRRMNFIFMGFFLLTGCGAVVTPVAYLMHKDKIEAPVIGQDPFIQSIASRFGFMALLSEMVYYRDMGNTGSPCDHSTMPRSAMTLSVLGPQSAQGKWERARNTDEVKFCLDDPSGVFYETFIYSAPDKGPQEAVIVFRGTEGPSLRDWTANLSAVTGIEPQQYRTALTELSKVMAELGGAKYKDMSIYAAGHSLGGGLAQQAGYGFKSIKAVYAFNTSPVTNWSWMAINRDIKNNWPVIYRIHHTGEALGPIRNISTAITMTRFNRYDIGVQLQSKSTIRGHAIDIFACGLAKIIVDSNLSENAHYYSVKNARHLLFTDKICAAYRIEHGIPTVTR